MKQKINLENWRESKDLGDWGEKYFLRLLSNFNAKKIPESKKQGKKTPDYSINLLGRNIKIENKTLEPYIDFFEILKLIEPKKKLGLKFDLSRLNINKEDVDLIKQFIETKELNNKKLINGNSGINYEILVQKYKDKNSHFVSGAVINPASNLRNRLSRKAEQIQKAEILSLVILNSFIDKMTLFKEIFPITSINGIKSVLNYNYDPWDKIKDIKLIIAVYPDKKKAYLLQNHNKLNNLSSDEINLLVKNFFEKGFDIKKLKFKDYLK